MQEEQYRFGQGTCLRLVDTESGAIVEFYVFLISEILIPLDRCVVFLEATTGSSGSCGSEWVQIRIRDSDLPSRHLTGRTHRWQPGLGQGFLEIRHSSGFYVKTDGIDTFYQPVRLISMNNT